MAKHDKKPYTGRDVLIQKIISGVTKAAVHTDKKKKADKEKCRERVKKDAED